jgi:hypothetical protein
MNDSPYYEPTLGEGIGQWNVHHKDGTTDLNVEWKNLPEDVKEMIRRHP